MLMRHRAPSLRNSASARCPGSAACGPPPPACLRPACPGPRDSRRRRSRCRSWRGSVAGAGGRAAPGTSTCHAALAAAGDSTLRQGCAGCASRRPGACRWRGGCCDSRACRAASGSGSPTAASTGRARAACGRQSPQGGHELLASGGVATCITQKSPRPAVRSELRFGFRVYSAGDMGAVPTGLPMGALR